ncbi:MAG: helix-turn-helix domain-containing protein [Moorea sp. SIO2I5]|nr:helix-turn-helix domain-containing protein [Moorena sp. SIO2I5]
MAKRIAILLWRRYANANYLSAEELLVHYRQATDVTERTHYQIIWLLVKGKTPYEVAEVTGYTRHWIYQARKTLQQIGNFRFGRPTPL